MAFNAAGLIKQIFQSAGARLFGGALGVALIVMSAFSPGKKFGAKHVIMLAAGALLAGLLIFLAAALWRHIRKRRAKDMTGEPENQGRKNLRRQEAAAVRSVRERWAGAMSTLKKAETGLYDLPWILLVGEPRSGKTTALRESGLDFPVGQEALSGPGGTVNCDWWFANDAVIIDTAGRFAMPADSASDRKEWDSLLGFLGRKRPRCPINGVIVTIPATSLLEDNPGEIKDKAGKIHDRLAELVAELGVEFPIYVMVSKLDLVFGFAEFFESLSAAEQLQIVGWNRKRADVAPFDENEFSGFFDAQCRRFYQWALRRLRNLPSRQSDRIYAFPWEFKRIKQPLNTYLEIIFKKNLYHHGLLWRGCFFSSGFQEGKAAAGALADGVEPSSCIRMERPADSFADSRPYFIHSFYKKVFIERGLVKRVARALRREKRFRIAAGLSAGLFFVTSVFILASGYFSLSEILDPINENVKRAAECIERDRPNNSRKAAEALKLLKFLEDGRIRLEQHREAGHFPGIRKEPAIHDLETVKNVLLGRAVIQPFLKRAGEKMSGMKPKDFEETDALLGAVRQHLYMLIGCSLSDESFKPLLDIYALRGGWPWHGLRRDELKKLLASYPWESYSFQKQMRPADWEDQLMKSLENFYFFWKICGPELWEGLQSRRHAYKDLLKSAQQGRFDAENFQQKMGSVIDLAAQLEEKNGKSAPPPDPGKDCAKEYKKLKKILSGGDKQQKASGATLKAVDRHSGICGELDPGKDASSGESLMEYNSIWMEDGSINPEFKKIAEALKSAMNFGPLFSGETRDLLKQLMHEQEDVAPEFYRRSEQWKKEKEERIDAISKSLETVSSMHWKKERLISGLNHFLNHMLWKSEQDFVLTVAENVFKDGSGPGTPLWARANWLEPRFEMLLKLENAMRNENPKRARQISAGKKEMRRAFWRFLEFWTRKLESFDPAADILSADSWQAYRNQVIRRQGIFLDPWNPPMNSFLEHVSVELLKRLQNLTGKRCGNHFRMLEKAAYVYDVPDHLAKLKKSQARFFRCVKSLPENPSLALKKLRNPEDGPNVPDFMSLSAFSESVGSGEGLSMRLGEVDSRGMELLKDSVADSMEKELNRLLSMGKRTVRESFPFKEEMNQPSVDHINNLTTISFPTASLEEMYEFLKGMEDFRERHGAGIELGADRKEFIEGCLKWKNFLFSDDGKPKTHRVTVSLAEDQAPRDGSAASRFTVLYMDGLKLQESDDRPERKWMKKDGHKTGGLNSKESDDRPRLRFSGSSYKKEDACWSAGVMEENDLKFAITAENEETGKQAEMRLTGGDLALLPYVRMNGKKKFRFGNAVWSVNANLPDPEGAEELISESIVIRINFQWDAELPEPMRWPG